MLKDFWRGVSEGVAKVFSDWFRDKQIREESNLLALAYKKISELERQIEELKKEKARYEENLTLNDGAVTDKLLDTREKILSAKSTAKKPD